MLEEILGIVRSLDNTVGRPLVPIDYWSPPSTLYSLRLPDPIPQPETYVHFPTIRDDLEALTLQETLGAHLRAVGSVLAGAIERLPVSIEDGRLILNLFAIPYLEETKGEEIIRSLCGILQKIDFQVVIRTSRPILLK
jgi:hypothetical protein